MASHNSQPPPPPVFQLPDWELPSPRPAKRTLVNRVSDSFKTVSQSISATKKSPTDEIEDGSGCAKEASAASSTLATHHPSTATANNETNRRPTTPLIASLRARFDAVFPRHRTYFGRPRRFILLYVVLPLAVFLLVILPLVIGLAVGLSRRTSQQDLPLPDNEAVHTGDLTYYDPALGACGVRSSSDELVCAVSHLVFDAAASTSSSSSSGSGPGSNPNTNPLCGMKIRVQRDFVEADAGAGAGNQSVDVVVVDRCEDCAAMDIDLSLAAFTQVALQQSGRVTADWAWLLT